MPRAAHLREAVLGVDDEQTCLAAAAFVMVMVYASGDGQGMGEQAVKHTRKMGMQNAIYRLLRRRASASDPVFVVAGLDLLDSGSRPWRRGWCVAGQQMDCGRDKATHEGGG